MSAEDIQTSTTADALKATLERALAARARGDLALAVDDFRGLCALEPANLGARCELAFTLLLSGELDEAETLCLSVLESDDTSRAALATLGSICRARVDHEAALGYFRRAAAAEPGDPPTLAEIARCLTALSRFDEAAGVFFEILVSDPRSATARRGLAEAYRSAENHAASLFFFTLLAQDDPADAALHCERGFALLRLARIDQAQDAFAEGCRRDPLNPAPYFGLAKVALTRERPGDAIVHLEQALEHAPTDLAALMDLGFARRALGDRPGALDAFRRASEMDTSWALPELAIEYRALGKTAEALGALGRVIALDPDNLNAGLQVAELSRAVGDWAGCFRVCDALAEVYPGRLEPLAEKARALIANDRKPEAIALCRSIGTSGADGARAHVFRLEIARLCADRVFAAEALAAAATATDDFDVWAGMVATRLALGDVAEARWTLCGGSPAKSAFDISCVHELEAGLASLEWNQAKAIEGYGASLAAHAANPEAHRHLARLYLLEVDIERSAEHLAEFLRQAAGERILAGQSLRLSQNLIGQLLNELRTDPRARQALDGDGGADTRSHVGHILDAVSRLPDFTPAALKLLLTLRTSGALVRADKAPIMDSAPAIPHIIMQFLRDRNPSPEQLHGIEVSQTLQPGWRHVQFNQESGLDYMREHFGGDVFGAARHAAGKAQFENLFRLAFLQREGGYVLDISARLAGPLDRVVGPGDVLCVFQDEFSALSDILIGCAAGEPVVDRAFGLAVEAMARGDNDIPWLATGPGLLTRAFAQVMAEKGASWPEWLGSRLVGDRVKFRNTLIPAYVLGR